MKNFIQKFIFQNIFRENHHRNPLGQLRNQLLSKIWRMLNRMRLHFSAPCHKIGSAEIFSENFIFIFIS